MSLLKYSLCFITVCIFSCTYGQSTFYKVYSGLGYDIGEGVAELPDSSFVVTGSSTSWEGSSQVYFMKIDSAGTRQWTKHYGGPESDGASRVLFNEDLGLYAIGYTNSIGFGDYNGLVVKTDGNGNEEWQKIYGKPTAWEFLNDGDGIHLARILYFGGRGKVKNPGDPNNDARGTRFNELGLFTLAGAAK